MTGSTKVATMPDFEKGNCSVVHVLCRAENEASTHSCVRKKRSYETLSHELTGIDWEGNEANSHDTTELIEIDTLEWTYSKDNT